MARSKKEEDTKKYLQEEELLNLEHLNQKIDNVKLKRDVSRRDAENLQLMIQNHSLIIRTLKNDLTGVNTTIKNLDKKIKEQEIERNSFVEELAKKYKIEYQKFGYDDETGEVLEYDPTNIGDNNNKEE